MRVFKVAASAFGTFAWFRNQENTMRLVNKAMMTANPKKMSAR
jgi:hypothetical protein